MKSAHDTDVVLSARDLTVRFGGVVAVNGVSFDVRRGQVFTLIGPNGAGKTTVFNLISRIYEPTAGTLSFNGQDITRVAPHRIANLGIARTFQNIELFEHATVLHNLLIGRHRHRTTGLWSHMLFTSATRQAEIESRHEVERIIDFLDLQAHRDSLIAGLPYGVRKVVELARALASKPQLLLLDEPSSGLNVEETEDMAYWIEDIRDQLGITVLMVEHDMRLVARVSDQVVALNQGEVLAAGTPDHVQTHPAVIEAYLGAQDDLSALRRTS
jgi:branched-chain amino acid transport system ATP-binding protein